MKKTLLMLSVAAGMLFVGGAIAQEPGPDIKADVAKMKAPVLVMVAGADVPLLDTPPFELQPFELPPSIGLAYSKAAVDVPSADQLVNDQVAPVRAVMRGLEPRGRSPPDSAQRL